MRTDTDNLAGVGDPPVELLLSHTATVTRLGGSQQASLGEEEEAT